VTVSSTLRGESVLVSHRIHGALELPALRYDRLVVRDETYHRHAGLRRYFWLVDHHVQMVFEPFGWTNEWYVDLVAIRVESRDGMPVYHMTDAHLDIVVEGMGPTYRVVDLDELADALRSGAIDLVAACDVMSHAQRFLDTYLHRGAPFPPPEIRPHFAVNHAYPELP
jgi:hypothetical protein